MLFCIIELNKSKVGLINGEIEIAAGIHCIAVEEIRLRADTLQIQAILALLIAARHRLRSEDQSVIAFWQVHNIAHNQYLVPVAYLRPLRRIEILDLIGLSIPFNRMNIVIVTSSRIHMRTGSRS